MDTGRPEPRNPNDIIAPGQQLTINNNDQEKINKALADGYEPIKHYETTTIFYKKPIRVGETETSSGKERESQADRMYKLFCEQSNKELFYDQNKTEFARIPLEKNNGINGINGIPQSYKVPNNLVNSGVQPVDSLLNCGNSVNAVNRVISSDLDKQLETQLKEVTTLTEHQAIVTEYIDRKKSEIKSEITSKEIVRLDSKRFKNYLAHLLFESEKKIANTDSISQVIRLLEYDASHGKCYQLYNRVAPDPSKDGSIWLDMADSFSRAYHITKTGWSIETQVPILFKRYEHQLPLVEAIHNGNVKDLLKYVNIGASTDSKATQNRQLLLLVQTASYFIPEIPHPINAMFGCPGSHKTYAQKCVRNVIDPSAAPTLRMPKDENAALQVLDHHYLPIFDNLFYMPQWLSDILCSSVTGAGQESRSLYTNDEPFIRSFKRCPLLNGVNIPATKGDLLSRTILHPTEPSKDRFTEKELDAEYAKVLPSILGGFLDIIVLALNKFGTEEAKPTKTFRLADFTEWGCAIALALGETVESFTAAMEENLEGQNSSDIENNQVAEAFLAYCTGNLIVQSATEDKPYESTPAQVFLVIEGKAKELGTNVKNTKKWPSTASAFMRKLNDSKNAIIASGWNYDTIHKGKDGRKMIIWNLKAMPPEVEHLCYKECGYYDKHECPKYGSINMMTKMPLKCGIPKPVVDKLPQNLEVDDRNYGDESNID